MASQIGFVLVSHDKPAQLLRLVRRLGSLYDDPPIVCHHDFSKSKLDGLHFPSEVKFVRPNIVTKWGNISCFSAFILGLRTMYERTDSPDWFVFLSGSDYPIRSAADVHAELAQGGFGFSQVLWGRMVGHGQSKGRGAAVGAEQG